MKKFFKWLGLVMAGLILVIGLFLFSMRFHDGPLEIISGGPFTTGELTPAPDDWSFLTDRMQIEFQTMSPATARTVWLGVFDGRLFLVSGYMTTNFGAIWKQWPHYIAEDDRVILRIDGSLYEQRLQRIMEGPAVIPVLREFNRKYGAVEPTSADTVSQGETWMYEVVSRRLR